MISKSGRFVVDSWAWIEYLDGSYIGLAAKPLLEGQQCFTCCITLAEVVSKIRRRKQDEFAALQAVQSMSSVLSVDGNISVDAGLFHAEQRKSKPNFALSDAFIYCCAKRTGAKILTTDTHFKGFKETILLGKK